MAIKATINNTEKEIEQIKNSNEQDIDYVYSRIGDTEVEGEPPISIKSVGGNLADYRIYGNTVGGESVGDRTGNLFDGNTISAYAEMSSPHRFLLNNVATAIILETTLLPSTVTINAVNGNRCYVSYYNTYPSTGDTAELFVAVSLTLPQNITINTSYKYIMIQVGYQVTVSNIMLNEGSTALPYEPYGYKVPVTVSNGTDTLITPIYLPEQIKKVGDEAEYIDYGEQKQHRIGADDINVTLPALSTIKGTNTLSVNTSIQPSNIYIKDNFDYKKVFTATRAIEDELPLNYKNIEDNDSTLSNYRIYGQTVNGESVGDKTKNLLQYPFIFEDNREVNGITYTVNSDKSITVSGSFSGTTRSYYAFSPWWTNNTYNRIPLSAGQTVTFSCRGVPDDWEMIIGFCQSQTGTFDRIGSNVYVIGDNTYTYTADKNCFIAFGIYQVTVSSQPGFTCYPQIEIGSIATEYEPYGCKAPVTVSNGADTQTIPIYLTEQIKKVGDEAEYIDYGEQKQHRVRKNLLLNTATSQTSNGVTFTVNNDKSITVNGTATSTCIVPIGEFSGNGNYILGKGLSEDVRIDLRINNIMSVKVQSITEETSFTSGNVTYTCCIRIAKGYTCNNLTLCPMIRKSDIEDDTYEPYITNTELDVILPALPVLPGTNTLTVGTEVQPSEVYIKGKIKEIN